MADSRSSTPSAEALRMAYVVSAFTMIAPADLFSNKRGPARIVAARHLLAALLRNERERTVGDVAADLGRGRPAISYAVGKIEEGREDADVDEAIRYLGRTLFDKVLAVAGEIHVAMAAFDEGAALEPD